eukprot:4885484-Pyramimonas_sp.AAC.1
MARAMGTTKKTPVASGSQARPVNAENLRAYLIPSLANGESPVHHVQEPTKGNAARGRHTGSSHEDLTCRRALDTP